MANPPPTTETVANQIWDVLVEHAGARECYRTEFLVTALSGHDVEFRFQGHLGFGGKVRRSYRSLWSIDCYPEDRNPERDRIMERVNRVLAALA